MRVGDLVAYAEDGIADVERGIVIDGPWDTFIGNNETRRYEIVWYTCGNKGWWEEKNLELVSESR